MKLKIEFIDGRIEFIKIDVVLLRLEENKLRIAYNNLKETNYYPLEVISRVTVDNEVIYDNMGRKENHKKEMV